VPSSEIAFFALKTLKKKELLKEEKKNE